MYYKFDIDWTPLSGPMSSYVRDSLMESEILPEMLAQIRAHFAEDGIDESKLIKKFQAFKNEYGDAIDHHLGLPPAGQRIIVQLYDKIVPYEIMVKELDVVRDYLERLPELRSIYEVMFEVYRINDNCCAHMTLDQPIHSATDGSQNDYLTPIPLRKGYDEAALLYYQSAITRTKSVSGGSKRRAKRTKTIDAAVSVGTSTDFSHMRSFTPDTAFDMSALYTFLVDEGVVDGIDERLFADCISHAHVNELWEIAGRLRKRNLMQCLFKMLAQEWYPREWISTCASNMGSTVKKLTNPTTSGATGVFEDKLRRVLRPPKSD